MEEAVAQYKQAKFSNGPSSKFKSFTGNLTPSNSIGGVFYAPPRNLSGSFHGQQYYPFIPPQQPPLLPSPSPAQRTRRSLPSQTRPAQSLNMRRSKSSTREQDLKSAIDRQACDDSLIRAWKNRLSSSKNISSTSSSSTPPPKDDVVLVEEVGKLSGSLYFISPPPSSLPLPKFSLRPAKRNCNVEAAGVDAGATDDLRRYLRLH